MGIQTVAYTMQVPKELKDVADLTAEIIKFAKSGKGWSEAGELLGEFSTAIAGASGIAAEAKSQYKDEAVAYLIHKTWQALEYEPPVEDSTPVA